MTLVRPRRWRLSAPLRALVRETRLEPGQLIAPLFVAEELAAARPVASMPGVLQYPVEGIGAVGARVAELGIGGVILFGIPGAKDPIGQAAWAADGVVQRAVRELRAAVPSLVIITDVCLCEYTDHGHCGIVNGTGDLRRPHLPDGYLLNDETLPLLARIAVSHAQAGAHVVAPSGRLDGMVAALRGGLDREGFAHLPILSYSAKYASAFYGPFREAAGGAPRSGDRASHQLDPANLRDALRAHARDLAEGADGLMVKPALAYLDVLRATRERYPDVLLAAYNVSGEYAMVKAAAAAGWLEEQRAVLELLTAIRRSGADLILTYHAADAARWMAA